MYYGTYDKKKKKKKGYGEEDWMALWIALSADASILIRPPEFTVELFNQYCHSKEPVSISRTQVEERGVFQDAINGEYYTKNNNHFCFTILATGEINSIRLVNDNGESEMLSWAFEKNNKYVL